ncbi:MAG: ShlB/FhaC/HecB family hemolysin secretion/activation protein [Lyngbya sp. HA4199-MV5]|jgi:hemolysin activation/secretion protein|nr:ShlB/FhaC/HecB family hemolysin secretion/activation protein [Lyngbya sp. HA4199-MV5]
MIKSLRILSLFASIPQLKPLTLSLVLATLLGNQATAIAHSADFLTAQTITATPPPPTRLEDIQPPKLPADVLPPPKKNELLPAPQLPGLPSPVPENSSETFRVDRIDVIGSTVFTPEQFSKVTAPFVGRDLTFAELLQARDAITKLYVDRGYVTTGALIGPQKIKDGDITIQVVEGSLQDIKVTGNRRLRSAYIRDRVRLGADTPLSVPHLLEKLQLLRLNPRIQNLSAELQAGISPGSNSLQVAIEEAKSFSVDVYIDNGRSPSVGSFRRGVELREANLLGLGDTLSVGYANTTGSNTINFSYALPVNARDGTVSFGFSQGWNRVIEKPFNLLDIQSTSRSYDLSFRQPILQTPTQELALGVSFSRQESQTELGIDNIGPFPLSPGADAQGRTRVSALRLFQEYTQRSNRSVLALRSQFSVGVNWFGATVNDNAPDSRFVAWRGQAQWVRLLAPDTLFLVRGDVQLAGASLVPLEQLGLGGQLSVRGYRQDSLLTDNGALFSAECRIPIVRAPQIDGILQLTPFIDVGTGWNYSGENPSPNTLVGVGLGLLWKQGDRLTLRFDWGYPLTSIDGDTRSLQEKGLYFSARYSF